MSSQGCASGALVKHERIVLPVQAEPAQVNSGGTARPTCSTCRLERFKVPASAMSGMKVTYGKRATAKALW